MTTIRREALARGRGLSPTLGKVRMMDRRAKPVPMPDGTLVPRRSHPAYNRWRCMLDRCREKPTARSRAYSGVKVCDRWHDFDNFLEDVGQEIAKNPNLSIDRINPAGDYTPENVTLVSRGYNYGRKRTAYAYLIPGEKPMLLSELVDLLEMPYMLVYNRLQYWRINGGTMTLARLTKPTNAGSKYEDVEPNLDMFESWQITQPMTYRKAVE